MLTDRVARPLEALRDVAVERLARTGVRPNVLTLCGLATSLVAAGFASAGAFGAAGLLLLGAGVFDALDGAIARRTNQSSPFGAFLDSVMDRYADLTVLLGLMLYYAAAWGEAAAGAGLHGLPWSNPALVFAAGAVLGSALTPYARARAESLIAECKVGIAERPERLVILAAGLLLGRVVPALAILAVVSNVTVLQRLFYVRRVLTGRGALGNGDRLLFWTYPRGSVAFEVLWGALVAVLLFA